MPRSVNIWFFEAGSDTVEEIKIEPILSEMKRVLNCEWIDYQHFGDYTIYFNDDQSLKSNLPNKLAQEAFQNVPNNIRGYNGNFMVMKSKTNEYHEKSKVSMPHLPNKNINQFIENTLVIG
jgi:hypothetical protein